MTKQADQDKSLCEVGEQLNAGHIDEANQCCQTIATRMANGYPHPRWANCPAAEKQYGKLSKAGKLTY